MHIANAIAFAARQTDVCQPGGVTSHWWQNKDRR